MWQWGYLWNLKKIHPFFNTQSAEGIKLNRIKKLRGDFGIMVYWGSVCGILQKSRGGLWYILFFSIIYFGHKNYLKEHGCPYEKRIFKYQIRSELDLNVKKKSINH